MKGKLITVEGTDACGKSSQIALLRERLSREGVDYRQVSFPRYDNESSALVRLYLGGGFGDSVSAVNPYAASAFFAVDRVASYLREWKDYLENGGLVILDRYTTSNAIYQATKLPESEREGFCDWLFDFEYNLLGLPRPSGVFFLDMPPKFAEILMKNRGEAEDVHERDKAYMKNCYDTCKTLAEKYGWTRIACTDGEKIKSKEEIHGEIYSGVCKLISK